MGGVDDIQWFDKCMDEIGLVFTKVDETIQKGIELWTELTRDIQPTTTEDLTTGQPNSGESGEENSSQYPVAEVKERPSQHWSMCLADVEEKPSQHWAMRAWKISESFIQEQSGDGDGDGEEEEDKSTVSEEDTESILMWMPSEEEEEEEDDDDNGEDEDVDTFSEEDDESWNDDDEENKEEDTTASKSSENMSELSLGTSSTSYIPSSYHHHNEEDNDSRLKWKGCYQLLKNVDTSSEEDLYSSSDDDIVEDCHYSKGVKEVMGISWKHIMMSNLSNEPLRAHEDEDDVAEKLLHGFVDVRQEEDTEFDEVEILFPESDWVYVTRDQKGSA
ncbi:hypothetical protein CARUB_v10025166mg [Capsella rubella]|uniref:Uncharacterized protein n=1 Tax=Capsella rubella TaxID=81985 RepID=R0HXX9_9BRAS|nr:mitotic apparatus protein p62 [Capsella rubella]EOA28918.1 hypothetical protein CARUB_v10025166mg [Capsella rubella]